MIDKLNPAEHNFITEKINEIIDYLNSPGIESRELGGNTPTEKYPDFTKWDKDAIDTLIKGLKVAPEDFYEVKDGKRKDYFTWDEAMEYERTVLKPNGWRLPTTREWYMLVGAYGVDEWGENDCEAFSRTLKMERRGYVPKDKMDKYNEVLDSGEVDSVGSEGDWWSSTATNPSDANYLTEYSGSFYPQASYYKDIGLTVRCVKAEEGE